jgi:endonuclease/exonuclease/phosphatase family metal-dependent hydrolase
VWVATRAALLLSGLISLASCGIRRAPPGAGPPPCLDSRSSVPAEWALRVAQEERSALDAWCWGVGPPSTLDFSSEQPVADSVVVLVWNANVGNGDLTRLLGDLRAGVLTGTPVRHFVVLLQEVHRGGDPVPRRVPDWAASASRIGAIEAARTDIVRTAQLEGLSLLYAPSMRNGDSADGGPAEDRGNAILSSLPLRDPLFVELPYERQRRVAVLASIAGSTSTGEPWQLRIANVHLDNRARLGRIHRSLGAAQLRQAEHLAEVLADEGPAVLGGDFNSWDAGHQAASVRRLRNDFPLPRERPADATALMPAPLPPLALDHLLFRLPDAWDGGYRVVDDTYDSDHRPLLGWVRFESGGQAGTSVASGSR